MNESDLIYLAGVLDAKGTFCVGTKAVRSDRGCGFQAYIEVTSLDYPFLESLKGKYGGSLYRKYNDKKEAGGYRSYRWVPSSLDTIELLTMVVPYLSAKREIGLIVLEMKNLIPTQGSSPKNFEVLNQRRQELYEKYKDYRQRNRPFYLYKNAGKTPPEVPFEDEDMEE